jgi:hypothetical protein
VLAGRQGAAGAEVAVEAPDPYSASVLLGNRNPLDMVPVKAHHSVDSDFPNDKSKSCRCYRSDRPKIT